MIKGVFIRCSARGFRLERNLPNAIIRQIRSYTFPFYKWEEEFAIIEDKKRSQGGMNDGTYDLQ